MPGPQLKSLRSPDDILSLPSIEERSVRMGEQTIGRATVQPGWRWSTDIKPVVGTPYCTFRHFGLCVSGRLHVKMEDGHEIEVGPDDAFEIPPGHDAWVVGDVPFESIEVAGIYGFGRPTGSGHSYVTSILLTDVVDSTATAERLGPRAWDEVLTSHLQQARGILDRYQGVEVATTGDGMLATFDGAARAARAAADLHLAAEKLGIRLRIGIHTGEVEAVPGNIRGMAVHVAARIAAAAVPGETWVSATTREVVSAHDLAFEARGLHDLKGVSGERELYAVRSAAPKG